MITLWLLIYLIEPQEIGAVADFKTLGIYTTQEKCKEAAKAAKTPGARCLGVNRLTNERKQPEFNMKTWW